ncbi:MAG: ABC transporter permease [Rhizobiales bacterium 65-9]|nr:ABC transporter permease [Hyphomicrobiales bacterium]OJY39439.1 MAG: ABC transporter permease [Rhizobiales bacterium 65-9]
MLSSQVNATVDGGLNQDTLRREARRETWKAFALLSPGMAVVCLAILVPIGWLFALSLFDEQGRPSFENYARLVEQRSYIQTFITTFQIAFTVTGVCIVLGYPLAYMLSQLPRRIAQIGLICVLLPFWTSVLVRTYAWLVLLQRRGLVNTWLTDLGIVSQPIAFINNFNGVVIGMTHILLPFLVLPLYASMRSIDKDCLRASLNLGASPIAAFWQVFLPLSIPGLVSGVVMVFVLSLGFYITPALMGGGRVVMWAMRIEQTASLYTNWGAASALGVVLLVTTLIILGLFQWRLGSRAAAAWNAR